jgi:hypothetical protein
MHGDGAGSIHSRRSTPLSVPSTTDHPFCFRSSSAPLPRRPPLSSSISLAPTTLYPSSSPEVSSHTNVTSLPADTLRRPPTRDCSPRRRSPDLRHRYAIRQLHTWTAQELTPDADVAGVKSVFTGLRVDAIERYTVQLDAAPPALVPVGDPSVRGESAPSAHA